MLNQGLCEFQALIEFFNNTKQDLNTKPEENGIGQLVKTYSGS